MRAALLSVLCPLVIFATGAHGASDSNLTLAVAKFKDHNYQSALDAAKECLKTNPDSRLGLEVAAKSARHMDRSVEAAYFAGRLYSVTREPEFLYMKASCLHDGKKYIEAMKVSDQVINAYPNYGPAYLLKAELIRLSEGVNGKYKELIDRAERTHFNETGFREDLNEAKSNLSRTK